MNRTKFIISQSLLEDPDYAVEAWARANPPIDGMVVSIKAYYNATDSEPTQRRSSPSGWLVGSWSSGEVEPDLWYRFETLYGDYTFKNDNDNVFKDLVAEID